MKLDKVLLPVDFSERSTGAARYAETLARHYHSELTLLHVLTPPHYEFGALEIGGSMLSELYVNRSAQVEKELESFLSEELAGLNVRRLVLEGDPARQIVDFAHQEQSSVIVMPTHGYGPFRRFILGSITAKVLHDADCPVLTGIHLEEAPDLDSIGIRSIVCGVDLGPQSCKALEFAASLQREFGAQLTVVHANAAVQDTRIEGETDWRVELTQAARAEVRALTERLGTEAEMVVEAGDPPRVVCDTAAARKADILVIGRGSARGVFGRLRTNAYAIIRQSPCPVISV